MYNRKLKANINEKLFDGKAIILIGPRQVGKTTLIKEILKESGKNYQIFNGDDPTVRSILSNPNTEQIGRLLANSSIIFIDEAQRIQNVGLMAKIIIDEFPGRQLILSGSSSFELNQNLQEPLTGRKWTYYLYPISWQEFEEEAGYLKSEQDFENRLIYGFYPDVLNRKDEPEDVLIELVDSYLFKDILNFAGIRKPDVIQKLVQCLAYQVGQEVVYKELADMVHLDPKTVSYYIDVLEKAFVVFRLSSYSKNLRNEIRKSQKIYFHDNGVRNAVISAYAPISARNDIGALWENFLVSERLKFNAYQKRHIQTYFWRTKQQQEVDYLEVVNENISAYEFKWKKKKMRLPKTFTRNYNAAEAIVTRENFRDFIR